MKYVDPKAKIDMVAPGDEKLPKEDQSILEITQLSEEEQAFLADIDGAGTRILMAMHLGLAGIRNFNGPDGTPVKLVRDETKRPIVGDKKPWVTEQLGLIPFSVQDKAAGRILRGVGLSEAEAKNF